MKISLDLPLIALTLFALIVAGSLLSLPAWWILVPMAALLMIYIVSVIFDIRLPWRDGQEGEQ